MQNLGKMITEQLRNPNELDISLRMEFGPFETVHKWKRMSECYEFVHRSSMFVFGGYTGDILANSNLTNKNDLFEYKFPSAQWVQWKFTGQEPVPRSAHGAAVYDDKLWIFAGYDGNARLNDMWTINLLGENHQWERIEQKGQCPPTCCNFPVAVARGKMFVFSGQSGAKITNALFQFDFETHTWSRVCTEHLLRCAGGAPARRYGHVMLAHRAQLYVFGGAADNTLPNDLHCYDLDTQIWSVVQPPTDSQIPSGRLFHAGAVVGDALYIFGGTVDNNVRSGELFRFQLSNYPRCTLHDDFGRILKSHQFCDIQILLSNYPRCTLHDDFGRILKSHQFCDIQILVGPEKTPILAHQAILAARSQFLRAKIKEARDELTKRIASGEEEATEISYKSPPQLCITLPEATPEAFNMVLNYIYTDRIDPTEKDEDPASPATVLLVMSVLRLALRLNVPRLRGLCARFLRANLCLANVLQALHAAHHAQLHCIKEYCLRRHLDDQLNWIQICDTVPSEEAFDSLLRYVYYGDTNMPTEDSLYLFQAPIYYGFTNNRLQVFCKHNLQSNVSPENVLAILQAADRMRATDIKEYALKMIVHHFGIGYISQVARQDAIKNLAQPLLVDIIWALAEEPHFDSPLPVQPRSLPSSSSADTLTDDPEYARHRCGKS
ncbi:hypothetical protein B5X24_HaOG201951 [Helicoverpa armigera]|uniref:BTB domain-containing protein n=1 Tax=Helicoverpa armigera TaxID=29058 RepID=A0A2W1BU98_HELAM|nr:hypothetical protein B5X24_HaOG201951 [Helicoverpa armigera]